MRPADTPRQSPNAVQTNYRPSRRRQKVVLVFEAGIESEGLIAALRSQGLKHSDYPSSWIGDGADERGQPGAERAASGPARPSSDVAAVIWKQPIAVVVISRRPAARHLYLHRWMQVLSDLAESCRSAPCGFLLILSGVHGRRSSGACTPPPGLKVPTICMNDPAVAAAFIRRHLPGAFRISARRKPVPHRLREATSDSFGTCAPAQVFQRYAEKEHDVRAVPSAAASSPAARFAGVMAARVTGASTITRMFGGTGCSAAWPAPAFLLPRKLESPGPFDLVKARTASSTS